MSKRLEKIAMRLLLDLEGVATIDGVQQAEVKIDLIMDAFTKVKRNERILSPAEQEWMEEKWLIFYNKYGKKKAGKEGKIAWMKLEEEEVEAILATVDEFVRVHHEVQFRPLPASYLNGRRWEDELPSQRKPIMKRETKQNTWQL